MTFAPTPQQQAILTALVDPRSGHLAMRARAGTGKTSTILMGVTAIRSALPGREILVCAYNKAIADEVAAKLKKAGHTDWRAVQAATLHSCGWGLVKRAFNLSNDAIDDKKVRKIVDRMCAGINAAEDKRIYETYGAQIVALVRMAKQAGFGFFPDLPIGDVGKWHDLADHYDINGLDDTSESDAVIAAAQVVYRASLDDTTVVDFDDMILFPLVKNLRVRFGKDDIFLDEYQDLSRARQALARKFLKASGRMIMVGDDRQAIYGFAGADAAAMENGIKAMNATVLPLSVTWRCPKKVVELAKTLVPDIEAAPTAIEGEVLHIPQERVQKTPESPKDAVSAPTPWYADPESPIGSLTASDAVLCRNTAPLISLAYRLIRAKIACKVEGRAIGEGLKALATRWKVKSVDMLLRRLDDYKERERQKAVAKGNEPKAEEVEDRVATLVEICQACVESGKNTPADVVAFIDDLFADGATGVTILCTAHRSKGREWKRVFLLEYSTRCPSKAARQKWQLDQEHNLMYVMLTRAQETLVFVG